MTTQNTEKITIRNVACLDLRTTSDETLAAIARIENVATLLYSAQTAQQVARLSVINVASMQEAGADAQIISGQEFVRRDFFSERDKPLNVIVSGQMMIMPDVQAEDVRSGIDRLDISGQLLYPDHLAGVIQSKIQHLSGQAVAYAGGARLTVGKLNLTEGYLNGLEDGSALAVIGMLSARQLLPNELLARKVREVRVIGAMVCREENAEYLVGRMSDDAGQSHTTVIPAGFEPVDGLLALDAALLAALPSRKLYCRDVFVAADVNAESLDEAIEALAVSRLLIAPAALGAVVARKCNLLGTNTVLYSGALWQFDGENTLYPQRFDFLEGRATVVVTGELSIAPEVEAAVLAQRVEKVHNLGEIICTPAQMSALQSRMGLNQGDFVDSGAEDDDGGSIGNTAYLRL